MVALDRSVDFGEAGMSGMAATLEGIWLAVESC
jgi:hypothetical protein